MGKTQTCLKPIYDKDTKSKIGRKVLRYKIVMPEIITEDLGFEMMFGFPYPKPLSNKTIPMKELSLPKGKIYTEL